MALPEGKDSPTDIMSDMYESADYLQPEKDHSLTVHSLGTFASKRLGLRARLF